MKEQQTPSNRWYTKRGPEDVCIQGFSSTASTVLSDLGRRELCADALRPLPPFLALAFHSAASNTRRHDGDELRC